MVVLAGLVACHVYNEDYACVPSVANPCGGVTVRHCAWQDEEDAGVE